MRFGSYLRALMADRKVSSQRLAQLLRDANRKRGRLGENRLLKKPQIERVLRGQVLFGRDVGELVQVVLRLQGDEQDRFNELYEDAYRVEHPPHVVDLELDAEGRLAFLPVPYLPYCGGDSPGNEGRPFLNQFLERAFELAALKCVIPHEAEERVKRNAFNMEDRVHLLEQNRALFLANLISLPRLRKLRFIPLPIRVSLNAVVLEASFSQVGQLEALREVIAGVGGARHRRPDFQLLVVSGEVGQSYAKRLDHRRAPEVLETLSHQTLSERLRACSNPAGVLITDELTALGVVRELKGKGRLLFMPTTDTAVADSLYRRAFPAHVLGFGYLHKKANDPEVRLLENVLEMFPVLEVETTARLYADLYRQLVKHVRTCLGEAADLYVGGVRRVDSTIVTSSYRAFLCDQNARHYARRSLQLSRRATAHAQGTSWTMALKRAREIVRASDARRRDFVRASLASAIALSAGLDPAKEERPSLGRVQQALVREWNDLRVALEREFDVEFPAHNDKFRRAFKSAADRRRSFEALVSAVQEYLESASDDAIHVKTRAGKPAELEELERHYAHELQHESEPADKIRRDNRTTLESTSKIGRIVAIQSGELIGALWHRANKTTMEIVDLFVMPVARRSRISQTLMRSAVAHADRTRLTNVTISGKFVPSTLETWFIEAGFKKGKKVLHYDLYR